jgi:hypothetical protein
MHACALVGPGHSCACQACRSLSSLRCCLPCLAPASSLRQHAPSSARAPGAAACLPHHLAPHTRTRPPHRSTRLTAAATGWRTRTRSATPRARSLRTLTRSSSGCGSGPAATPTRTRWVGGWGEREGAQQLQLRLRLLMQHIVLLLWLRLLPYGRGLLVPVCQGCARAPHCW